MKKGLTALLVVVCVLAVVIGLFVLRFAKMARTVQAVTIEDVDVTRIQDGSYEGAFGDFLVFVRARVSVVAGRIVSITITEQRCGPGYEAKGVVDRILAAQTPRVDAVSGATGSSRCIMAAVSRALVLAPHVPGR
jgi:uncharacterized protein with FMN-binding domain